MRTRVILATLAACGLVLAPKTSAQFNPISFPRLMPHKSPAPPPATPRKVQAGEDYHQLLEILIELAWLADPITFPHMLEAKVEGGALRVRGKTPNDGVREQALKLARLHCPMKVMDETKPGAGLPEKTVRMNPLVLQQAVQSALREALPCPDHGLKVHSELDGKVVIEGHVKSFADKLAVSKKLQRMHGCACVINQLEVRASPAASAPRCQAITRAEASLPVVRISKKPRSRFRTLLCLPGKCTRAPNTGGAPAPFPAGLSRAAPVTPGGDIIQRVGHTAPAQPLTGTRPAPKLELRIEPVSAGLSERPFETRGVVILPDGEPAAMSAHQLKEQIFRVCGQAANNVGVHFKSPTEVDICLNTRSPAEASRMARLIMQIPELMTYQVDIRVKLVR